MNEDHRWWKHLDFVLLDVATVEIVYCFCVRFWLGRSQLRTPIYNSTFIVLLLLGLIAGVFLAPLYRDILKRHFLREILSSAEYVSVIIVLLMLYQYMMQLGPQFSRGIFIFVWFFGSIAVFAERQIYKTWLRKHLASRARRSNLILVTDKEHANEEIARIANEISSQFTLICVAIVEEDAGKEEENYHLPGQEEDITILYDTDRIFDFMQQHVVDDILLNISDLETNRSLIQDLIITGVTLHISMFRLWGDLPNQKAEYMGGRAVLTTNMRPFSNGQFLVKRMGDIIGSLIGLAITGILFLIFAPVIKKQSPGPVFYSQWRVGLNGRKFRLYKFRSMYPDADARKAELMKQNKMDGFMFKMDNDPRIFPIGRFIRKYSIDEFPQFWNVLKGDMSLVGTRPPTVDEWEQYSPRHRARLGMKPGITGLWQVSGRSNITDFEEVVNLDVQYICNWSLTEDIKILLRTIGVVFTGNGSE